MSSEDALKPPEAIEVGRVVRAHGVRGGLLVRPASEGSDVLLLVPAVELDHAGRRERRKVTSARPQGKGILLQLEGVTDRNGAEALAGAGLWLREDELPPPEEGEYYVADLMGLSVVTPSGEPRGRVVDLESSPAQDWLVVERDGARLLIPFTEGLVEVEFEAGRVVVDGPEDLFDPTLFE